MENSMKYSMGTKLKSIVFSSIGVFAFFVNIKIGEKSTVPMVHVIDFLKKIVTKPGMNLLVVISCIAVVIMSLMSKFSKKDLSIRKYYKKDGPMAYFMYFTATIFALMTFFQVGPEVIINPTIGGSSIGVAGDVLFAVIVAGTLVSFLLEFGFFEFLGKLLEPIMRRVYKLPGKAAVDALSSFVASAAVGVMITNDLYKSKEYTDKEACSITTNFSVCSLGAFAFLSATAGVGEYYMPIVLTGLILTFILAAIMIRIPPLSRKKDVFIDGTVQTEEERKAPNYTKYTFSEAVEQGLIKADSTEMNVFSKGLASSVMFGVKVVTYVVSLSVISLILANYTPIAKIIGAPMIPILNMLGLPDAAMIAPSTLVGIFGLAIPSVLLKGQAVAAASAFFIVVLSTSQIIFFTESANAMLESEMPLSILDLVVIFFVRTIILIPIIAIIARIMFL